jgi:four helix bundle protein
MQQSNAKQGILKRKASALALKGYALTDKFPREELFGLSSQLRRSLVSVPSNVIEGLARNKVKVFENHLDIAYGSLCEAKYQMYFACQRGYITKEKYLDFYKDAEEVSKMLWASITTINKNLN